MHVREQIAQQGHCLLKGFQLRVGWRNKAVMVIVVDNPPERSAKDAVWPVLVPHGDERPSRPYSMLTKGRCLDEPRLGGGIDELGCLRKDFVALG